MGYQFTARPPETDDERRLVAAFLNETVVADALLAMDGDAFVHIEPTAMDTRRIVEAHAMAMDAARIRVAALAWQIEKKMPLPRDEQDVAVPAGQHDA